MKKEIIVMGDIELGGGTLTDDFISDQALSTLILSLSQQQHPIDLILNGDTFDFLKCPYINEGEYSYPRHVTEEVSLGKLHLIEKNHSRVFNALRTFVHASHKQLYFIIGNHDHDLFFPAVKREIRRILNQRNNVHFRLFYDQHGVYSEHGQQYDYLNKANTHNPFLTYKGKKILNLPFVSLGIISQALELKEEHPFLERIKPYPLLFQHHRQAIRKLSWRSFRYFFLSILYYPLRFIHDPTYRFPSGLFGEFYRRVRTANWDVDNIVEVFKRKRKKIIQKNRIHILGHIHEKFVEEKGTWAIIHPDTWRDEYTLDPQTKELIPKKKKYVQVFINNDDGIEWHLQEYPRLRNKLPFPEVIKDEIKFLHIAAQEEDYPLKPLTPLKLKEEFSSL